MYHGIKQDRDGSEYEYKIGGYVFFFLSGACVYAYNHIDNASDIYPILGIIFFILGLVIVNAKK